MKFSQLHIWYVLVSFLGLVRLDVCALKTIFTSVDEALKTYDSSFETGDALQLAAVMAYMKPRFTEVLKSDELQELDEYALITLLAKNWIVEESEVFKAVAAYIRSHPMLDQKPKQALINQIHFVALQPSQLEEDDMQEPEVLPQRSAFKIVVFIANGHSQINNMFRYPNQLARKNVALESMGAEIMDYNCAGTFFDDFLGRRDSCMENEFVVKLGAVFTVSQIEVGLFQDTECLAVETSVEGGDQWESQRKNNTRTFKLQFEPTRIRFIRIKSCAEKQTPIGIHHLIVSKPGFS